MIAGFQASRSAGRRRDGRQAVAHGGEQDAQDKPVRARSRAAAAPAACGGPWRSGRRGALTEPAWPRGVPAPRSGGDAEFFELVVSERHLHARQPGGPPATFGQPTGARS